LKLNLSSIFSNTAKLEINRQKGNFSHSLFLREGLRVSSIKKSRIHFES